MKYLLILPIICFKLLAYGQNRILADGEFDDWVNHPIAYADASGDGGNSNIDFGTLKLFNDDEFIFLSIEMGTEINLQDFNNVVIYIDTDNDKATGSLQNGIGADMSYSFGGRSGTFFPPIGSSISIGHSDIGLITAPTVTSNRFEIAIQRTFIINGNAVSMLDSVNLLFKDNDSNGDVLPSISGGLTYVFSKVKLESLPSYSVQKPNTSDLRIMSYNVERDAFFEANKVPAYTRILKSIQPDIIGFQEIYNHTSAQVAAQVESMLPSSKGEQWYHAMANPDCHAISRYPIVKSAQIPGSGGSGNGAFLIDIPNADQDLLLIVAHPPCCTNNTGRQLEVDQIMKFIRVAKEDKGAIPIEMNAPIVIVGDMNFVGDHKQLTTLLAGDISDESTYGPDFKPDWDGNNLIDCKPHTTGVPFAFTWYSESSAFSPGKLDYILYTGSNLVQDNSFTLFTRGLHHDSLSVHKLQSNDIVIASDHLPVVADFTLKSITATNARNVLPENIINVFPNPVTDNITIAFANKPIGAILIQLKDISGKHIATIHQVEWDTKKLQFSLAKYPSGSYILEVNSDEIHAVKKISVIH